MIADVSPKCTDSFEVRLKIEKGRQQNRKPQRVDRRNDVPTDYQKEYIENCYNFLSWRVWRSGNSKFQGKVPKTPMKPELWPLR